MSRGRLIFPILADIARLDTLATSQDPDGAGPETSGYDDDFKEPVRIQTSSQVFGAPRAEPVRCEQQILTLPAQYESSDFELMQQWASGKSSGFRITLVFHFKDFERLGLLAPDGAALLRNNDRLVRIRHKRTGALIHEIPDPPGLYAIEPEPTSLGLRGGFRNLLEVRFEDRERSVRRS